MNGRHTHAVIASILVIGFALCAASQSLALSPEAYGAIHDRALSSRSIAVQQAFRALRAADVFTGIYSAGQAPAQWRAEVREVRRQVELAAGSLGAPGLQRAFRTLQRSGILSARRSPQGWGRTMVAARLAASAAHGE